MLPVLGVVLGVAVFQAAAVVMSTALCAGKDSPKRKEHDHRGTQGGGGGCGGGGCGGGCGGCGGG